MKEVGGYFELELNQGSEYHKDAIRLNSGRNAFEYILRTKVYKKVYLPYYTCEVMFEPVEKLKLEYECYHINDQLEPLFEYERIESDQAFIYTNYFGIKSKFSKELSRNCKNLIIDNSQAFFDKPIPGVDTFYSPRKFFGLPDGAYLFTGIAGFTKYPLDNSTKRFLHLIKRIDEGAKQGYSDFKINDASLSGQPIKQMSKLTRALLCSINYEKVIILRKQNFEFLNAKLFKSNEIKVVPDDNLVPMVYPYMPADGDTLRQKLINDGIYVARYWPNIANCSISGTVEVRLAKNLIPLPIDQRYGIKEMKYIVQKINKYYA